MRTRTSIVAAAAAAGIGLAALAGPAAAQSDTGTVTVVHGIPDTPVDVYVNDELTLDDFQPGTLSDALSLPPADYNLEVFAADADPASAEPVLTGTAPVTAGANASVVAHLTEAGQPALGVFPNDTSELPAGQARLTVRHTAAAPAVDVRAGGSPVLTNLTNPNEGTAVVPAGTVSADVTLAGSPDPVIGPADLPLGAGTNTIVYAIGSAEAGNLSLLTQTIDGLGGTPSGVPGGSGGLAADDAAGASAWALALVAVGGVGTLGSTLVLARARTRRSA